MGGQGSGRPVFRYTVSEQRIIDYVLNNLRSDVNPIKRVEVNDDIYITYEDGTVKSIEFTERVDVEEIKSYFGRYNDE